MPRLGCVFVLLLASNAAAQPTNASVQGSYYFRYLGVNAVPRDTPLAFQGTLVFDGKTGSDGFGTFTASGLGTAGAALGPASNNVYRVLPSGLMDFTNPLDASNATTLFGGMGTGALVLSSTDSNYCDLMVAVPVSTSNSAANLNGKYYLASMEFLNGSLAASRNTFFSAMFDGKGGLGSVTINGTAANLGNAPQSQTSAGATYTVGANGIGSLSLPGPAGVAASSVLLSGNKVMYVAPDGSFFVAGGATAYDLVIGVKALAGSPSGIPNGFYFTATLENDALSSTAFTVSGADGTANEIGPAGIEIGHRRINPDNASSYDYTYGIPYKVAADGTGALANSQFAVGAGGNVILGSGLTSRYLLEVYVKSPAISVSGAVFLNPQGVANSASSAPFSASVAPGEFVTLVGTGLASQTAQATTLPFPTVLGNVQVTISWVDVNALPQSVKAPLYFVSPTQINALVPYTVPSDESLITLQVSNNGVNSTTTRVYSGLSAPGVFTIPSGGIGNGAIEHADYSLVSSGSPAKVGETVLIYLTGLGAVTPQVTAGTAAPSNPLSETPVPKVYIDGKAAAVVFSGLTPGAAGLYQLNVTIPAGVTAGANVPIEIDTFDNVKNLVSMNVEATIPIAKTGG